MKNQNFACYAIRCVRQLTRTFSFTNAIVFVSCFVKRYASSHVRTWHGLDSPLGNSRIYHAGKDGCVDIHVAD